MLKRILTVLILLIAAQVTFAVQSVTGVKTLRSQHNVQSTVTRLVVALRRDGYILRGLVDHQKIAKQLGHTIKPNVEIMTGYPQFDYAILKANPLSALFTPLTMVVWQDDNRHVYISYWDPKTNIIPLLDLKHGDVIKMIEKMSDRLATITSKAAERHDGKKL